MHWSKINKISREITGSFKTEETSLRINYGEGNVVPDNKDHFLELYIIPDFKDANGELLNNLEELIIN